MGTPGKGGTQQSVIHHFHIDYNAPCLHPPPPPHPFQFCITSVSNFSWILQSSQEEKSKATVMQQFFFGGGGGGTGGKQGASWPYDNGELQKL